MYNDYLEILNELKNNNKNYAIATVISSTGSSIAKPGFRLIVSENRIIAGTLGSRKMDSYVLDACNESINKNMTKNISIGLDKNNKIYDYNMDTTCGGVINIFIEPFYNSQRIIILTESDEDEIYLNIKKIAGIIKINLLKINTENEKLEEKLNDIDLKNSYFILLTKNEKEIEYLSYILKREHKYIGLVASKNRFNNDLKKLKQNFNDDKLNEIDCPAGIMINAITPEEIAVSLISKIILLKNSV